MFAITDLPAEIVYKITLNADNAAIFLCTHVYKQWRQIIINNWRGIMFENDLVLESAELNAISVTQYFLDLDFQLTNDHVYDYALHGNIPALDILLSIVSDCELFKAAMITGNLQLIDYIKKHNINPKYDYSSIPCINYDFAPIYNKLNLLGFSVNIMSLTNMAVRTGNLQIYKMLMRENSNYLFNIAITRGHYELVKFMSSKFILPYDSKLPLPIVYDAAKVIKCAKFAMGKYSNINYIGAAIEIGDIPFVEYCISRGGKMTAGAKFKHAHMIEYFIKQGGKLTPIMMEDAIDRCDNTVARYYINNGGPINLSILQRICELDIDIIISAYSRNVQMHSNIINDDYETVYFGDDEDEILEKLKYLFSIRPDKALLSYVCAHGHLKVIKFLASYNQHPNNMNISIAAGANHVHLIEYFAAHYVLNYEELFIKAIEAGAINVIKFICNIRPRYNIEDNFYTNLAAKHNQYFALKLLRRYGYSWGRNIIKIAIKNDSLQILRYAINNNCNLPQKYNWVIGPQIKKVLDRKGLYCNS